MKSMVLAVHNRERAAVGVPPLVWNDKLAADAKTYAEHLATTGKFDHPSAEWVAAHPMSPEGENLAAESWPSNDGTDGPGNAGLDRRKEYFSGLTFCNRR